jgi:hypothetical protein
VRRCWKTGKRAFERAEHAQRAIDCIRSEGALKGSKTLNIWLCEHCQGWHFGHTTAEQRARLRERNATPPDPVEEP